MSLYLLINRCAGGGLCSPLLLLSRATTSVRLYQVQHSTGKRVFYVELDEYKQAVLYYRLVGDVMDLRSTNVPKQFSGRGIAKLLTETAFTHAITHHLRLYLTCSYSQNYYLCNRNDSLQRLIIGPKHILDTAVTPLDQDSFDSIPDPQDYIPTGRTK